MINLLPPDVKENIAYARRNRILVRWLCAMAVGVLGLFAVVGAGQLYILHATKTFAQSVEQDKESLRVQKVEQTEKRIEEISASTKLVTQVLSREVRFSKLLQGIGATLPPGTSLQNLSISQLEGAIDLQVGAIDYNTATQAQVNLQDPANKVFEKADIQSISCAPPSGTGQVEKYPCQVSLRALFAKDSPYLVTATQGTKK